MASLPTDFWPKLTAHLRLSVGDDAFESWLKPLTLSATSSAEGLEIEVPTKFLRDWVLKHYADHLVEGIVAVLGQEVPLQFVVKPLASALKLQALASSPAPAAAAVTSRPMRDSSPATPKAPAVEPAAAAVPEVTTPTGWDSAPYVQPRAIEGGPLLNPNFTFETFVVGKSNQFAYAAAQRIAESTDNKLYNPFLLHGGVGLGKTHLMHAIAWRIHRLHADKKVLYMSADKFINKFVGAIRGGTIESFKDAFRSVDVLMIDDVQFIAGKEATQEEFFHTFNALIEMDKRIILSADRPPQEMVNIEDRLRSRLGCGLTTEIHMPDVETRLAILEAKAAARQIPLSKDVALLLADKITTNIRELEGALNRLLAHAELMNEHITVELARTLLKDLFRNFDRVVSVDDIQKKVADFYHIKLADMSSPSRAREVARPRQIAMFLAKQLTTKSYPEIGRNFGGRDHTTVMHAVKHIQELREQDPALAEDLRLLESLLAQ